MEDTIVIEAGTKGGARIPFRFVAETPSLDWELFVEMLRSQAQVKHMFLTFYQDPTNGDVLVEWEPL